MSEYSQATWDMESVAAKTIQPETSNEGQTLAVPSGEDNKPTRVITVRLPRSLHEALKDEAKNRSTSLNQLCVAKLLQVIDGITDDGESMS